MQKTFTTDLTFAKSKTAPISLSFQASPHAGKQAATRGRIVLTPDIELSRYGFQAVIDWLEVEVEITRPTQFRYLQEELRAFFPRTCYVESVAPSAGDVSAQFTIRIQEPKSAVHVQNSLEALTGGYRLVGQPILREIEVSVDASPSVPNDLDRALMLGVMNRTIFTKLDVIGSDRARPRFCLEEGAAPIFSLQTSRLQERKIGKWLVATEDMAAPMDATFNLGALGGPALIKVMDKVVDQQNRKAGTFKTLADVEKRVRIEVTLKCRELEKLGLYHLEDLRDFSFAALQGSYFQFKLPTFEATDANPGSALSAAKGWREDQRRKRFLTIGVMGLEFMRHAREAFRDRYMSDLKRHMRRNGKKMTPNRQGTGATGTLVAYEEMNRLISNALSGLGKRERTAWRQADRKRGGATTTASG